MNRQLIAFALAGLLASGFFRLVADDAPAPPPITTSASTHYPEVTCTTSDTVACADALQMAADARQQLGPLLKLGPNWRFPVNIHVMTPDDPLLVKVNREASAVFADGEGMHIVAVLPVSDPDAREFIQRQYVTALLWEKFFANTKSFDAHTPLNTVPVWLVEGLREWLNDDPLRARESIVRKAVAEHRAPSLVEITGWTSLSKDRLLGLWQRAFCFYLVDSIVKAGPRRDDFQQWLASLAGPNPSSAQQLFPTEAGWQRELVDATQRSRDMIYTWDETVAELNTADIVSIPEDKQIGTLDNAANFAPSDHLTAALQKKLVDLTNLEMRAHPSWHDTLEAYRAALTALLTDKDPAKAQKWMVQARTLRNLEMTNHQKLVDYVNWFEVTRDYPGTTSRFSSYFTTAQELEKVQADPKHPNAIRADLLHVESQLSFNAGSQPGP